MHLLTDILILIGGITLLPIGGEMLVRGAVTLAVKLGVSTLIVGLTVVAFGTSAPELAFNVIASINDHNELSFGNIVGSNIANIGLILGLAAMLKPLKVHSSVIRREMPIMIGATALMCVLAAFPRDAHAISRPDGILMLSLFLVLGCFAVVAATRSRRGEDWGENFEQEIEEVGERDTERSLVLAVVLLLAGLTFLAGGGKLAEMGAVGLAESLGWAQQVIGLTIVALATSLPELTTSLIAVRRDQVDIAVGNVVGSNIFNILLVLGTTATVSPVTCGDDSTAPLIVMAALTVILWFVAPLIAG